MIPIEKNRQTILNLLEETERDGIHDLINWLKTTEFFVSPASTRFHLCVKGGLAQHSLNVYDTFRLLNHYYYRETLTIPSVTIPPLLHDICKHDMYIWRGTQYGYRYVDEPPHGARSVELIKQFIELSPKEEAMIRWHMGYYHDAAEFNEVKNDLSKEHPEAHLLYFADHIASLFVDKVDNNICPDCGIEMLLESYDKEVWQKRFRCPKCGNLI